MIGFYLQAVLGGNAVVGEQNIVALQSTGEDGKSQKGAIAHLTRGQNPMVSSQNSAYHFVTTLPSVILYSNISGYCKTWLDKAM